MICVMHTANTGYLTATTPNGTLTSKNSRAAGP